MQKISVFIVAPVSPSVERSVDLLFKNETMYIELVQIDESLHEQILSCEPCVVLFSFRGSAEARVACSFMTQFWAKVQAIGIQAERCRFLFLSEDESLPLERWQPAGVHEFIFAPILPKQIEFKLLRQCERVLDEVPDESIDPKTEPYKWVRIQIPEKKREYVMHIKPSQEKTKVNHSVKIIKGDYNPKLDTTVVVVEAKVPRIKKEAGIWRQKSFPLEGRTEWHWVERTPEGKQITKAKATGERPVFNSKTNGWIFWGNSPSLKVLEDKKFDSVMESKIEDEDVEVESNSEVCQVEKSTALCVNKELFKQKRLKSRKTAASLEKIENFKKNKLQVNSIAEPEKQDSDDIAKQLSGWSPEKKSKISSTVQDRSEIKIKSDHISGTEKISSTIVGITYEQGHSGSESESNSVLNDSKSQPEKSKISPIDSEEVTKISSSKTKPTSSDEKLDISDDVSQSGQGLSSKQPRTQDSDQSLVGSASSGKDSKEPVQTFGSNNKVQTKEELSALSEEINQAGKIGDARGEEKSSVADSEKPALDSEEALKKHERDIHDQRTPAAPTKKGPSAKVIFNLEDINEKDVAFASDKNSESENLQSLKSSSKDESDYNVSAMEDEENAAGWSMGNFMRRMRSTKKDKKEFDEDSLNTDNNTKRKFTDAELDAIKVADTVQVAQKDQSANEPEKKEEPPKSEGSWFRSILKVFGF